MTHQTYRQAQEVVKAPHLDAVTLGQIIINSNNVYTLASQGIQIGWQVATRVLPSPVRISAILPSWRQIPPIICTSKCLMPKYGGKPLEQRQRLLAKYHPESHPQPDGHGICQYNVPGGIAEIFRPSSKH